MTKKRKIKKKALILVGVISFFVIYLFAFSKGVKMDEKPEEKMSNVMKEQNTQTPLITQIKRSKKIYLSDESDKSLEGIKIEEEYWDEIKYFLSEFSEVRSADSYSPLYTGYSADGVRFSTDLSFFRVYTVNKEEYYKVPVSLKKDFERLIKESMYTSFDSIKQYKTWENVTIEYNGKTKRVSKWKYDELAYKMVSKRMVGKVQPEKSYERSDYNFKISIKGKNYETTVETMGKDYVKVISHDTESYYEVHTGLFDYIKTNVFKIEDPKKESKE